MGSERGIVSVFWAVMLYIADRESTISTIIVHTA